MDPNIAQQTNYPGVVVSPDLYVDAQPVRRRSLGGCIKPFMIVLVVFLVCGVVGIVLFADIQKLFRKEIVSYPTSYPVSNPVSSPDGNGGGVIIIDKEFYYEYAGIGLDDTIRTIDNKKQELYINLTDSDWKHVEFSPNGKQLAALGRVGGVYNLLIHDFEKKQWQQVTVYNAQTGGIDSFGWIANEEILYTQAGWLYNYNNRNQSSTKLKKVDTALVELDSAKELLLFKKTVPRQISAEVSKPNAVYYVANFDGTTEQEIYLEKLITQNSAYVLYDVILSGTKGIYFAVVYNFNTATGAVSDAGARYFQIRGTEVIEIFMPVLENYTFRLLGTLSNDTILLARFDVSKEFDGLVRYDLKEKKFVGEAFKPELSEGAKVTKANFERLAENLFVSLELTKSTAQKEESGMMWYEISSTGSFSSLEFAEEFKELVRWNNDK